MTANVDPWENVMRLMPAVIYAVCLLLVRRCYRKSHVSSKYACHIRELTIGG